MSQQLHITENEIVGKHWTEVDVSRLTSRKLTQMRDELAECGASIDPNRLFIIEACGYTVDLSTGEVRADE